MEVTNQDGIVVDAFSNLGGGVSKTTLADLRVKHRHVAGGHIFDPATTQDLIEAVESIGGRIMEVGPFGNPGRWLILRLDDSHE